MTQSKCDCMVYTGWTYIQCCLPSKFTLTESGHVYNICGKHLSHYNRGNRIRLKGSIKLYTVNEPVYEEKARKAQEEYDQRHEDRDAMSKRYWLEKVAEEFGLTYKEAIARLKKKAKGGRA